MRDIGAHYFVVQTDGDGFELRLGYHELAALNPPDVVAGEYVTLGVVKRRRSGRSRRADRTWRGVRDRPPAAGAGGHSAGNERGAHQPEGESDETRPSPYTPASVTGELI